MVERDDVAEDGSTTTRSRALRVLFLSSDTGGGHRASAEALGAQFASEFPGSSFELLDVLTDHGCAPYRDIVPCYRHLSARPRRWKLVYEITNTRFSETVADVHLRLACERRVRDAFSAVDPDVVVSVHPMMNRVPAWCCQRVGRERGRHLPFFTVVTDLGGAHSFWFCGDRGVEAIYVATDRLIETAENECRVPRGVARRIGLPIRRDFAVEAERLGNRCDDRGRAYQTTMRRRLFGDGDDDGRVTRNAVLVMGGGEGVGSLRDVVRALHARSRDLELDVTIVVVCGRNETLRRELQDTDWDAVSSSVAHPLSESPMIRALRLTGRQKEILSSYAKTMERVYPEFFGGRRDDDDDEKNGGDKDGERDFDDDDRLETSKDDERDDESGPKTKDEDDDVKVDSNDAVEDVDVDVNKKPVSSVPFFRGLFDFVRPRQRDDGGDNNPDPQRTEPEPKPKPSSSSPSPPSSSSSSSPSSPSSSSSVVVLPLGFVSNVAEHMVAADALVTKAGPGTIAEAAALGLPVLLTSFLPGQERGNVDHVVSRDFGAYRPDRYPGAIASEVGRWLRSRNNGTHRYRTLVANALQAGNPYAARDIARSIGESALRWRESSTTTTTTTTSDPVGAGR